MSNKKRPEAAEMESTKNAAPARLQPGQGRDGDSRHLHTTTEPTHLQGNHAGGPSQPAAVQRKRLLAMLRRGPVTTLEARAVAIMSPATRIFELKRQGHRIVTTRLPNRVGVYHLVGEAGHD